MYCSNHPGRAFLASGTAGLIRTPSGQFRELAVTEWIRGQGLPSDYPLGQVSESKAFTLIGNAAPPAMAEAYARRAQKFLRLVSSRGSVEPGLKPKGWTLEARLAARSFDAFSEEAKARLRLMLRRSKSI